MGNQSFQNHEFFAIPGANDNIHVGNVYEYIDSYLKFYDQDQYSNLIETQMVGLPNTFEQCSSIPYPDLDQLKRIHISNPKILPIKAITWAISFMLPYRQTKRRRRDVPLGGAIVGYYTNNFVPSIDIASSRDATNLFCTISKAWRSSFSTLHKRTEKFIHDSTIRDKSA